MKVRELMSSSVHSCRPEDSLASAARKLWEHDCGALPVVDAEGRVRAVITDRDICMGALTTGVALQQIKVENSMSRDLVGCRADDEIKVALERMKARQVHRLPVVDDDGRLCGILSLNDLAIAPQAGTGVLGVLAAVSRHRAAVPTVVASKARTGGKTATAGA